jgi:hypothetical protein
MPDYVVTQANASAQFDRFAQPIRKAFELEQFLNKFSTNTAYVEQDGGYTAAGVRQLTAWTLAGVNMADGSRNVTDGGRLWIRITANGGNWDIHIYKALAAANEVATATNVAAGAVATLTAANSSGLTGTCTLAASIAAVAGDTYSIKVHLGWAEMDRQIYASLNGTNHQEDGAILAEQAAVNDECARRLAALVTRCHDSAKSANMLTQVGRIWRIPSNIPFLDIRTENDDGTISVFADGVFERMRQNWSDNTTVQKVPVSTCAAGAASYAGTNSGASATTVGTLGDNIEPGTIQAVCVKDDPLGAPEFEVTFTPTDGTEPKIGQNNLTVNKVWTDPEIPVSLSVVPTYAKTGDDGDHTDIAAVSFITEISGLTSSNSDDGKLYGIAVASGAAFIYKFYSDSSRTKLVAQSTAVANDTSFSASSQNRSGVTVGWKSGSAVVDQDTFTVDVQPHKVGTATTPPDSFTVAITQSAKGELQDCARRYYNWKFNEGAAPTFADTFLFRNSDHLDGAR